MKNKNWYEILISVLTTTGLIVVIFIITGIGLWLLTDSDILLSMLFISGMITLLATLTAMSVIFAALNLSDPRQALSLPEGSIRAVIALSLILIFAIMSVFLFKSLRGQTQITEYKNITEQMLSEIPREEIIGIEVKVKEEDGHQKTLFDVQRKAEIVTEQEARFAEQLITTISTLVVAIAAFYFGTRSVATARDIPVSSPPLIHNISPNEGEKGKRLNVIISGENFESPKVVKFVKKSHEMYCYDILSNKYKILCSILIKEETSQDKWDLIVVNADDAEARLEKVFTITAPPPPPPPITHSIEPNETGDAIDKTGRVINQLNEVIELLKGKETIEIEQGLLTLVGEPNDNQAS